MRTSVCVLPLPPPPEVWNQSERTIHVLHAYGLGEEPVPGDVTEEDRHCSDMEWHRRGEEGNRRNINQLAMNNDHVVRSLDG